MRITTTNARRHSRHATPGSTVVAVVTGDRDGDHIRHATHEAVLGGHDLEIFAALSRDGSVHGSDEPARGDGDGAETLLYASWMTAIDAAREAGRPDLAIRLRTERGPYVRTLVERTHDAALMVVGRLGVDPLRLGRLGGARGGLIAAARCPVVRAVHRPPIARPGLLPIAAAVHSPADVDVLETAAVAARTRAAPLVVVRSSARTDRATIDEALAAEGFAAPPAVTVEHRQVHPGAVMTAMRPLSGESQLIVTRAHDPRRARSLRHRFDTHERERLLHSARCPVMMVPRRHPWDPGSSPRITRVVSGPG